MIKLKDRTQNQIKLKKPQLRVWSHPHYIGRNGDDYYRVFSNIKQAMKYIRNTKSAEKTIMLAVNGYEYNLME